MVETGTHSMRDYPESFLLPRTVTGREPQHVLMTLLGDYWRGRREMIPASVLVELLAEFEITETSARQAMRRLKNRGLLVHEKVGRQSFYGTPDFVAEQTDERWERVLRFGQRFSNWDEMWTVVSFSVPERDREVRRQLRHELTELKFGMLHDAVWISPHQRVDVAVDLLNKHNVVDANVMRATFAQRPGFSRSFSEIFGIEALSDGYADFVERFTPVAKTVEAGQMSLSDALVWRTEVMSTWLQFRQTDPSLPSQILPADWPRARARELNYEIYDGLGVAAEARFRQILERADPNLAKLTSHHTSLGA